MPKVPHCCHYDSKDLPAAPPVLPAPAPRQALPPQPPPRLAAVDPDGSMPTNSASKKWMDEGCVTTWIEHGKAEPKPSQNPAVPQRWRAKPAAWYINTTQASAYNNLAFLAACRTGDALPMWRFASRQAAVCMQPTIRQPCPPAAAAAQRGVYQPVVCVQMLVVVGH